MEPDVMVLRAPPEPSRDEVIRRLRAAVARLDVSRAYLFGSFARGDADRWSDVDLLVIAESERSFLDRYLDFGPLLDVYAACELLVYTPSEFAALVARQSPFVLRVLSEGIRLDE